MATNPSPFGGSNGLSNPVTIGQGGTGAATAAAAIAALGGLGKVADSGTAGFALQNATPNILTWTAPSDSNQHTVLVTCVQHVTVAETGGAVQMTWTGPDGTAGTAQSLFAGGASPTVKAANAQAVVQAGSVVTVQQSSALTAGTCTVWTTIFGN